MLYSAYLKTLKKCPFCDMETDRILHENEHAYLTYSLAPNHKHHLLIIPKRHLENLNDVTWAEEISIASLLHAGIQALAKIGSTDCSIMAKGLQKSIPHLHYHIIPGGFIRDISLDTDMRKLLTDDEQQQLISELKKIL